MTRLRAWFRCVLLKWARGVPLEDHRKIVNRWIDAHDRASFWQAEATEYQRKLGDNKDKPLP